MSPKPLGHQKSPMPAVPPTQEELDKWANEPVKSTEKGAKFLILMNEKNGKNTKTSGFLPYPDYILNPDENTIKNVEAMTKITIEFWPEEDLRVKSDDAIPFTIIETNNSKQSVKFELSSLKLTVTGPSDGNVQDIHPE
jgi:hypothetical protein